MFVKNSPSTKNNIKTTAWFSQSPQKKTYCLIFKFHLKLPYLILQSQGTAVAGIDTVATGIVSFRAAGGAGAAGAAGGAARLPETATPLEGSTVARKDSGSKRNIWRFSLQTKWRIEAKSNESLGRQFRISIYKIVADNMSIGMFFVSDLGGNKNTPPSRTSKH